MKKEHYALRDEVLRGEETVIDTFRPRLRAVADYLRGNSRSLKQSYAAVFLSILTDLLAGFFLGSAEELLTVLPGLVVLVPAALGMRGQIFASLGSRLGSALHIGSIERFDRRNPIIKNNIYASLALTIIFSVFLGLLARSVLLAFGMDSISVADLVVISVVGGVLSGLIMLALTIGISFFAARKGWDPDNLTSPLITALGDFFTVPTLLIGAYFVTRYFNFSELAVLIIASGIALVVFLDVFVIESKETAKALKEASYRQIVLQSSVILVFTLFLDSLSGVVIQSNLPLLVAIPVLLVILPAFLEEGGNVGNIMASRLSTKLHLGSIPAKIAFGRNVKLEFLNAYILALMIFTSVGVMTYVFSLITGLGGLSLTALLLISLGAGLLLTTCIVMVTFLVSVISFRFNIDPDNTAIPVITSVADVVGVFCLLLVFRLVVG